MNINDMTNDSDVVKSILNRFGEPVESFDGEIIFYKVDPVALYRLVMLSKKLRSTDEK